MASTNASNDSAAAAAASLETGRRHPVEKSSAEEAVVVPPEVSRFPKDLDGASHGPVWQTIAVPLKADPANNPSSEEWDQAKQAFKDTGLLKRIT